MGFIAGSVAPALDPGCLLPSCGPLGLTETPIQDGRPVVPPDPPLVEGTFLPDAMAGGLPMPAVPEERIGAADTGLLEEDASGLPEEAEPGLPKEDVRRWPTTVCGAEAAEALGDEVGGVDIAVARDCLVTAGSSSSSAERATSMLSSSCFTVLPEKEHHFVRPISLMLCQRRGSF